MSKSNWIPWKPLSPRTFSSAEKRVLLREYLTPNLTEADRNYLSRVRSAEGDAFLSRAVILENSHEQDVSIGIAFTKRFGAGLFGGEGFILERLQGDGLAFMHAGGTIYQRELAQNEVIRVDTGCIVAFQPSVAYDIQYVGRIKTALFGGEGLFFATLRGPGRIWLQSLPFSRLAGRIYAAAPQTGRGGREEGSILGGLGRLIDGDNS